MRKFLNNHKGFTLVEILASLTIFSLVAIPMMGFFVQASKYTTGGQNKTIAMNVARNVLTYIEKQDFSAFSTYLDDEINSSNYFLEINYDDCNDPILGDLLFNNRKILIKKPGLPDEEKDICLAVLKPIINGDDSFKDKIKVYMIKYDHPDLSDHIVSLKNYTSSEKFKNTLTSIDPSNIPTNIANHLIRVYVVVHWDANQPDIVLEGVLANEKIR